MNNYDIARESYIYCIICDQNNQDLNFEAHEDGSILAVFCN